jgi:hypothetical protein
MKSVNLVICTFIVALTSYCADAQSPTVRPLAVVVSEAAWASHKTAKDQNTEGAQGRKYDVMKCYAITAQPAFKCVALDLAGYILDSGMAAQFKGQFMDAYWEPNTARNRMLGVYLAANISPEDGMREIRFMQGVIDKTLASDLENAGKNASK